jgi:hypothetical protein
MYDPFVDLDGLAYRPTESALAAEKERAERKKREEAFWDRPEDEVRRDLIVPEEDLARHPSLAGLPRGSLANSEPKRLLFMKG